MNYNEILYSSSHFVLTADDEYIIFVNKDISNICLNTSFSGSAEYSVKSSNISLSEFTNASTINDLNLKNIILGMRGYSSINFEIDGQFIASSVIYVKVISGTVDFNLRG